MNALLDRLRGGLIVSCQAKPGSAMDHPAVIAALAQAAQDNGAVAVRIQGVANLRAVRARVNVPVIGLIKREYAGFEPYITPTLLEADEILETGAQIVAFDATDRPHPGGTALGEMIHRIQDHGALAMADCATVTDGRAAAAAGAALVGTTLCGYTKQTAGAPLPALDIVRLWKGLGAFRICEGGIHSPQTGRAALEAGADAIVVGTAITGTDWLVSQFAGALRT